MDALAYLDDANRWRRIVSDAHALEIADAIDREKISAEGWAKAHGRNSQVVHRARRRAEKVRDDPARLRCAEALRAVAATLARAEIGEGAPAAEDDC